MISVMNAIFGMPNIISPNELKKQSREKDINPLKWMVTIRTFWQAH